MRTNLFHLFIHSQFSIKSDNFIVHIFFTMVMYMKLQSNRLNIIVYLMSKIQAEIKSFTQNQTIYRMLKNFYRCSKTISLINSLFYSSAINKKIYREEVQQVFQTYCELKKALKDIDLQRFCELWQIEFHEKVLVEQGKDSVPVILIWIANHLPRVHDEIYMGNTYDSIYQTLRGFCRKLQDMKDSCNNIRPSISIAIDDLILFEKEIQTQYKNPTDFLPPAQKERLMGLLNRFRVEFGIEYRLV